jgi:hypothetical protein
LYNSIVKTYDGVRFCRDAMALFSKYFRLQREQRVKQMAIACADNGNRPI